MLTFDKSSNKFRKLIIFKDDKPLEYNLSVQISELKFVFAMSHLTTVIFLYSGFKVNKSEIDSNSSYSLNAP